MTTSGFEPLDLRIERAHRTALVRTVVLSVLVVAAAAAFLWLITNQAEQTNTRLHDLNAQIDSAKKTVATADARVAAANAQAVHAGQLAATADTRVAAANAQAAHAHQLAAAAEAARTKAEADLKGAEAARTRAEADLKGAQLARIKAEADLKTAHAALAAAAEQTAKLRQQIGDLERRLAAAQKAPPMR